MRNGHAYYAHYGQTVGLDERVFTCFLAKYDSDPSLSAFTACLFDICKSLWRESSCSFLDLN